MLYTDNKSNVNSLSYYIFNKIKVKYNNKIIVEKIIKNTNTIEDYIKFILRNFSYLNQMITYIV